MNLAEWSMRYRPVVITLVGLLSVWGIITFFTMPRREDPEFTIRTCVVSTRWPGAPTVKVEELVTDKIEDVLDGLEEVSELRSTTINGLSTIYVDLEDDVPVLAIQNVWDKVRAKVELVQMPDRDIRPVVNDDFGDTSVLVLAVYQKPLEGETEVREEVRYTARELEIYADKIRDAVRLVDGVAKVEKFGVQDEAIYIETDLGNWSQINLTSNALKQLIESRNIVSSGGSIDTASGKFNVKPEGEFDAVSEIEAINVGAVQSGDVLKPVRLADVGLSVDRSYVDPATVICRFSDEKKSYPAVMLGITMRSGGNIVDVCESCVDRLDNLIKYEQALPGDLGVTPVSQQSDNVTAKINDVISNVISAIVIVVIVVFLFVGARTSLVMAANIPIVVMASIAVIRWFGVELEQISLASIIIALGLLVDNAVQVCDQTRVNLMAGMTPGKAAVEAAKTLMSPMLIGTLTTVAAFFPMLFALEGAGAEYVYSLPVTLSTTLLLSWFLAMSVCVILASAFIRAPKNADSAGAPLPWLMDKITKTIQSLRKRTTTGVTNDESNENPFLRVYGWTAKIAIANKWLVVLVAVGLLVGSSFLPVSTEFFPQDRRDQFFVNVELPETSTIEQTRAAVEKLEAAIIKLSPYSDQEGNRKERLRAMRSMVGGGGSRWALGVDPPSPASNVAEILVRTTDGKHSPGYIDDIRKAAETGIPELEIAPMAGVRVIPKALSLGPPAEPVVLRVSGDGFANISTLRRIADDVKQLVEQHPDTWDVHDTWGVEGFQITLDIDEQKANLAGVTNSDVANTMSAYYTGVELSEFREGDHQIPVFFRLSKKDRSDLSGIEAAYVEGENGKIPLNSIADAIPSWQPAKIERKDLNRTIEVKSEVENGVSGNDVVLSIWRSDDMNEILDDLPNGYTIEIGGSYEESQDSATQMMTSFGISFLAIVFILVVQYNGWSKTLMIIGTLPLAVMGALLGLWATDNPLGFMPQLGLLSLFGIVLNTGIIFIEFADLLIEKKAQEGNSDGPISGITKEEFRECLVAAGKQRMLPIFLTTATTVGGLLPLALSGGPLWEGLAWLMIFGLLVATVLTLYIVPALYAIFVENFGIQPIANSEPT